MVMCRTCLAIEGLEDRDLPSFTAAPMYPLQLDGHGEVVSKFSQLGPSAFTHVTACQLADSLTPPFVSQASTISLPPQPLR